MENPGSTLVSNQEFKNIVKEYLCDSILKNSVSPDRPVFSYSLGIFISLVFRYENNIMRIGEQFQRHLKE